MTRARIVIAEDSNELRRLLAAGLEHVGLEVLEAENGTELVEIVVGARRSAPTAELSLIITDVRMPGLDGVAAVEWLRRLAISTPVIFMTAFGDARIREAAGKLNSRWIDKPVSLSGLRLLVAEMLRVGAG